MSFAQGYLFDVRYLWGILKDLSVSDIHRYVGTIALEMLSLESLDYRA